MYIIDGKRTKKKRWRRRRTTRKANARRKYQKGEQNNKINNDSVTLEWKIECQGVVWMPENANRPNQMSFFNVIHTVASLYQLHFVCVFYLDFNCTGWLFPFLDCSLLRLRTIISSSERLTKHCLVEMHTHAAFEALHIYLKCIASTLCHRIGTIKRMTSI